MTPLTGISSCTNCQKVFSMVDQLTKSMHDFEIFTMEMEFDPVSVKFRSQEVLSNFWTLISTIKSFTMLSIEENGQTSGENQMQSSSSLVLSVEKKHQVKIENEENENENGTAKSETESELESESDYKSKSKSKSSPARKMRRIQTLKPRSNPNAPLQRLKELQESHKLLRTIECKTREGFYNLYECINCQRQFNDAGSGRRHIQLVHLNLGMKCPACSQKYFTKPSLQFHMSRCSKGKGKQFKQIRVSINSELKKPVKVQLYPHKIQQQKQQLKQSQKQKQIRSIRNQNQIRNRNSNKKTQNKNQRGKKDKLFDPLKTKVRNPCPYFSLRTALSAKVMVERLKMDKNGKILSAPQNQNHNHNQTDQNEEIELKIETGTETTSSMCKEERE